MLFMLTINATRESEAGQPPDPRLIEEMRKFITEITQAGVLVGNGGLAPSALGAMVRVTGGKVTVTDGPFAEAKELIGGYAIVNVKSKAEAVELSRRFWQIHADVFGPSFEGSGQIRRMFEPSECGGTKLSE